MRPWATLALAALAVSGCTAGMGGEDTPSTARDTTGRDTSALEGERDLTPYLAQDFSWGECDTEWFMDTESQSGAFTQSVIECAEVLVPATYIGTNDIPDFSIALMRAMRTPSSTGLDPAIFINPGGPGGSGIEQLQWSDFPEQIHQEFAFIGFDPRGVGFSDFSDGSEIECSDELDYLSYFGEASPANEAEIDAGVATSDEYYEDCAAANPYWWTLSTDNVAKDLNIIRHLVTPDQPLNFIGSSYGTTIAGRYVSNYPEWVGKIVFDSPTTVDDDRIESALINFEANEVKLRGFVEGYAAYSEISFEEAWDRVLEVRQMADDQLLGGYAGFRVNPAGAEGLESSEALFLRGIIMLNYYPADVAQNIFNQGMEGAYLFGWNGTFEWLAFSLDGYDPDSLEGATLSAKNIIRSNEFEVRVIVNSMDYSADPLTEAQQRELSARAQKIAPLLSQLYSDSNGYEYFGPPKGLDWDTLATRDDRIPNPPTTPFVPSNPSGKPLLIVGSLNESVTPYAFAKDTAALLGATLVSVAGETHAPAAGYDNDCINDVLIQFFLSDEPLTDVSCGSKD